MSMLVRTDASRGASVRQLRSNIRRITEKPSSMRNHRALFQRTWSPNRLRSGARSKKSNSQVRSRYRATALWFQAGPVLQLPSCYLQCFARAVARALKILFYAMGECELLHIGELKITNLKTTNFAKQRTSRGDDSEHRAAASQFCDEDMIDR